MTRAPCPTQMYTLSGIVFKLEMGAAVHLLVDVWEACYNPFHKAMRSKSVFGEFDPPMLCHEMARHVAKVTVFYNEGLADPRTAFPTYFDYIGRRWTRNFVDQMTGEKRAKLAARATAFLQAAQAKHLGRNVPQFSTPRMLLGERAASSALAVPRRHPYSAW